jgi:hypothetical protein
MLYGPYQIGVVSLVLRLAPSLYQIRHEVRQRMHP